MLFVTMQKTYIIVQRFKIPSPPYTVNPFFLCKSAVSCLFDQFFVRSDSLPNIKNLVLAHYLIGLVTDNNFILNQQLFIALTYWE